MITNINQLDLNKKYTYSDYLTWQFEEMVELIKGKVFKMAPGPGVAHQSVSGNLHALIWNFLKNKPCKSFSAPFDVRLPLPEQQQTPEKGTSRNEKGKSKKYAHASQRFITLAGSTCFDSFTRINTVVQPDICVICELTKLDEQGCNGAPDWIIEILSKSTARKDLTDKFEIYQNAGVKEYWVVQPREAYVLAYYLDDKGKYQLKQQKPFTGEAIIPVSIFPGFEIDLKEVF